MVEKTEIKKVEQEKPEVKKSATEEKKEEVKENISKPKTIEKPTPKGKVEDKKIVQGTKSPTSSQKTATKEREYTIPLRAKYQHVARYKKTPKAVKTIKEFLVKHMKVYDRDLNKIKIDKYLNEFLWFRGIKKPPYSVKVKTWKDGEVVRVELVEMPDKLKFKKLRAEKIETNAKAKIESKKSMMQKAREGMKSSQSDEKSQPKESMKGGATPKGEETKESEEEKAEKKEKVKAGAEESEKLEKAAAKTMKHSVGGKTKAPKSPVRKVM